MKTITKMTRINTAMSMCFWCGLPAMDEADWDLGLFRSCDSCGKVECSDCNTGVDWEHGACEQCDDTLMAPLDGWLR